MLIQNSEIRAILCYFFFAIAVSVSILNFKEFSKALNPEINARSSEY
jgi:hypothetical protein